MSINNNTADVAVIAIATTVIHNRLHGRLSSLVSPLVARRTSISVAIRPQSVTLVAV